MKFRKFISPVLAFSMLLTISGSFMPMSASAVKYGFCRTSSHGKFTYNIYGSYEEVYVQELDEWVKKPVTIDHAVVSSYGGFDTNLIIPAYIDDDIPVTGINDLVFYNKKTIVTAELPETLEYIGEGAFAGCEFLEAVEFPESMKEIKANAFRGCSELKSVTFSENIFNVEQDAFYGTKFLGDIKASGNFGITGDIMFGASDMKADENGVLAIPDGVRVIAGNACAAADITSAEIPDSVVSICDLAFDGCSKLENVTYTDSVSFVGGEAFRNTPWLQEKRSQSPLVSLNDVVIDGASCSGDVMIPDNITLIASKAFMNNSKMTSAVLPASVSRIDTFAFAGCKSLTSLTIMCSDCMIADYYDTVTDSEKYRGVIKGFEDSTAEVYAKKYEYTFEMLENAADTTLYGDANCDGKVTIADSTAILQHMANQDKYGLSPKGEENADCYDPGDGVSGLDALSIQKLDAQLIDKLPEFPDINK